MISRSVLKKADPFLLFFFIFPSVFHVFLSLLSFYFACDIFFSLPVVFYPFPHTHTVSRCSCRGRGQLWRGLSQSKDSDWGAIRALHLDTHSGEAVMLHPLNCPPPSSHSHHTHTAVHPHSRASLSVLQQCQCLGNHWKWHRETNAY